MKKIISLFQRNYDGDKLVRNEVVPGAGWVNAGEGVATRKFDGSCCLVHGGKLFKRYEVVMRRPMAPAGVIAWEPERPLPTGFEPATEVDPTTRKQQGWVPVSDSDPADRWHREAWANQNFKTPEGGLVWLADGTYELLGPKVQGNPEREFVEREVGPGRHLLVLHGCHILGDCPRDFAGLRAFLETAGIEGVVWWRDLKDPDCDKVKIKRRDFFKR